MTTTTTKFAIILYSKNISIKINTNVPIITCIPLLQRPFTVSNPIPEFPPVTNATLVSKHGISA